MGIIINNSSFKLSNGSFQSTKSSIPVATEFINNPLFNSANCISYYRLENTSDSKGVNTLTNIGGATFATAKFNNGVNFGTLNSTKYLSISSNLGISGNASISISAWVKLDSEPSEAVFYVFYAHASTTGADRLFEVYYTRSGGVLTIVLYAGGNQSTVSYTFGTTSFRNVVAVRDVSSSTAILYIDGVEITSVALGTTTRGNNAFTIGADDSGASKLSGIVDDLVVFDRVLSLSEINSIY